MTTPRVATPKQEKPDAARERIMATPPPQTAHFPPPAECLTRAQLAVGLVVRVAGPVFPRGEWKDEYSTHSFPWASTPLRERPRGMIVSWKDGRFGGVFVEVQIGKAVETHAMTDLVVLT